MNNAVNGSDTSPAKQPVGDMEGAGGESYVRDEPCVDSGDVAVGRAETGDRLQALPSDAMPINRFAWGSPSWADAAGEEPLAVNAREGPFAASVIVDIEGWATYHNAVPLREALDRALGGNGSNTLPAQYLVLNLSHLRFMDTAGLAVLMAAHRTLSGERGGAMRAYGANPVLLRIFQVSRLYQLVPLFATEADALSGTAPLFTTGSLGRTGFNP